MVCDLKKIGNNSKGILVFTHKERKFLSNKYFCRIIKKEILKLRKIYILGIHWRWFKDNYDDDKYIDFHLVAEGSLNLDNKNNISNKIINLCNRNFIDEVFKKKKLNKIYDVISVTRPVNFKNNKKIFENVKKLFSLGKFYKILILFTVPSEKILNSKGYYNKIFEDYNSIFSESEKNYFTLLPIFTNNSEYFLSKETISNFMNLSKSFLLAVEKEGASRVIHEALLCGLPIITHKRLQGGGLDYLDEKNSVLFKNFDEMYLSIIEIIENIEKYTVDEKKISEALHSKNQKKKLFVELKNLFENQKLDWNGEINFDNLDRRLDGHFIELENNLVQNRTNVIKDYKSFYKYIVSKLDLRFSFIKFCFCFFLDFAYLIKNKINQNLK